ncbi:SIR2 family protein [Acetobacter sp. LMG 32666]|uniref:SIR2 family NAD-dependent protein deacylase n=1 Tax=Acetobacter sp. LMG 32666 TaxID=2959295 RepID=UPI0030C84738
MIGWDHLFARMSAGHLVPYLGPGMTAIALDLQKQSAQATGQSKEADSLVPSNTKELADFFGRHVALPKRARGNPWAAAQYIESKRHRQTLDALMDRAFAQPIAPSPLHFSLAASAPSMIVDTWYDGIMRVALSCVAGNRWGEVQGTPRTGVRDFTWFCAYDAQGDSVAMQNALDWKTLLYKPHGSVSPAHHYLVADSDYVEVLTELDIQTPIPDIVQQRRIPVGFLFLGCRFDDQMLRSYARQIMKRSAGPHYAILPDVELTRNELRFLDEMQIARLDLPLVGHDYVSNPA